jgi:hypothetical protein
MKRTWTIIAVADVVKSAAWYGGLLAAHKTHPGAAVFDQIVDDDGEVLLCLHWWGRSGVNRNHHWPSLQDRGRPPATVFYCGSSSTTSTPRGIARTIWALLLWRNPALTTAPSCAHSCFAIWTVTVLR